MCAPRRTAPPTGSWPPSKSGPSHVGPAPQPHFVLRRHDNLPPSRFEPCGRPPRTLSDSDGRQRKEAAAIDGFLGMTKAAASLVGPAVLALGVLALPNASE